jgi:hypothetical protein
MAKKEQQIAQEMTIEEARAFRAAKHVDMPKKMSEPQKREAFRMFWAQNKAKYGKKKDLEGVLWVHLKAIKMDTPDKFNAGISHFGLKRITK